MIVSYTDLRQNLSHYMDQAIDSHAPVVVTRQGGKGNVVMLSEEEFEGWQETVHLLSSPRNAARLMDSILELKDGGGRSFTEEEWLAYAEKVESEL